MESMDFDGTRVPHLCLSAGGDAAPVQIPKELDIVPYMNSQTTGTMCKETSCSLYTAQHYHLVNAPLCASTGAQVKTLGSVHV